MRHLFVSHASDDKTRCVNPLVRVLTHLGFRIWVDRPGATANGLGFSSDYVSRNAIAGIPLASDYRDSIREGIKDAGAVLGCLSKALIARREILEQEIVAGYLSEKLVTCVIDDLALSDLPQVGLVDVSKLQCYRVDCHALKRIADFLDQHPDEALEKLPDSLFEAWQVFEIVVDALKNKLMRHGAIVVPPARYALALARLREIPIGPIVHFYEIPQVLIDWFATKIQDPAICNAVLAHAMQMVRETMPAEFTEQQMLLTSADVHANQYFAASDFWINTFSLAGHKSRRTLAALLLCPGAPPTDTVQAPSAPGVSFLNWLARPISDSHRTITAQ